MSDRHVPERAGVLSRLPAVVATDLDGTLLRSDRTVSQRTREALDGVVAAGSRLVYVTGRPPRLLAPVVEQTGHTGTAICANGALVLDLDDEQVVQRRPMARATATRVIATVRAEVPGALVGVEWEDGFAHEPAFAAGSGRGRGDGPRHDPAVRDDEQLVARPVCKLLVRHPERGDVGHAVAEALGDMATVTWSTNGALAEVSAPGVDKGATLADLVAPDGHGPPDVVAFGDMPNDLALLRWAGWGVAVDNAHERLTSVADEVTASNDHDGVAQVLERLLAG